MLRFFAYLLFASALLLGLLLGSFARGFADTYTKDASQLFLLGQFGLGFAAAFFPLVAIGSLLLWMSPPLRKE